MQLSLFGQGGLRDCCDVVSFDAVADQLRQGVLTTAPSQFVEYFERRIVGHMRQNVLAGDRMNVWTNNNCESMNNVLKHSVNWQPRQLPDLIDRIKQLVVAQYADADRAIVNLGDYALRPQYDKYRVPVETWKKMTELQRQKAVESCFKLSTHVPSTVSSDGKITVPNTPCRGRKPHQRKRGRNERTTTRDVPPLAVDSDNQSDMEPYSQIDGWLLISGIDAYHKIIVHCAMRYCSERFSFFVLQLITFFLLTSSWSSNGQYCSERRSFGRYLVF